MYSYMFIHACVCVCASGKVWPWHTEQVLTELSIPRARSMMKNTMAQNVDPDRVEMASGYRMKTRPAPGRNGTGTSGLDGRQ